MKGKFFTSIVEHGIPIPDSQSPMHKVKTERFPFASMCIGDSFFVPLLPEMNLTLRKLQQDVNTYAYRYKYRNSPDTQWSTRQIKGDPKHGDGVRCWRVK